MPASAKLALAALLAASILRAFYGPPPETPRQLAALRAGAFGVVCYVAAVAVAFTAHATAACALLVAAVEALCLAVWLARGRDDRPGGEPEPEPDPPVDWARFDRERARWERPRTPAGV
ncbi:MAG TPA: hypothetical protein VGJ32_02800 [Solirubrobacteraceae bacterium]|jgi:hypothetical protein